MGAFYPLVVGGGVSPRKLLKMDTNGAFWTHIMPSSCWFFLQKLCVIFAFKSSDLRYTWCRRIFTLAEEDHIKLKRGVFLSSCSRGGGGWRGLPEKIFENGCKWCILNQFLPIACWSPQLCVIFAFKALIYVMPEIIFPFARGSPPPFFFVKNGCKWWILRPVKADWVLVFSWNFTFVIKSPDVQGMWCGSFPSFYINMGGVGFFSCVGRIQGATLSPPPNILKNLCNIYSETIISRLNVCLK